MQLTTKVTEVPIKPGCWSYNLVEIFDGENKIGEYTRNYHGFSETTFAPFKSKSGKWYALCSPRYTGTSLISLPDCQIIGGEDECAFGFCPMELWVPSYKIEKGSDYEYGVFDNWKPDKKELLPEFLEIGFVGGCVWGDDSSTKLQVIDLRRADEGIIERKQLFGYFELYSGLSLREAIELDMDEDRELTLRLAGMNTHLVPLNIEGEFKIRVD